MAIKLAQHTDRFDIDDDACWEVALGRDTTMDGVFVVAVKTTGIYCRPSCSARRPKRENVVFLRDPDAAEAAGFRACKRCHPRLANPDEAAELVRKACDYLDDEEPPRLPVIAKKLGLSAAQLQRTFRRVLGVTPGSTPRGAASRGSRGACATATPSPAPSTTPVTAPAAASTSPPESRSG